jgi:hypothetical protein
MGKFTGFFDNRIRIVIEPHDLIRPGDVGIRLLPPSPEFKAYYHNLAKWQDFCCAWEVKGPIGVYVVAERRGNSVAIIVRGRSIDATIPGAPIDLNIEVLAPSAEPDENSNRWMRALLRWFYCHELDEFIHVDGVRIFDPHDPSRPTPTPENG